MLHGIQLKHISRKSVESGLHGKLNEKKVMFEGIIHISQISDDIYSIRAAKPCGNEYFHPWPTRLNFA